MPRRKAISTEAAVTNTSPQGRYWLGTINDGHGEWCPPESLPDSCVWLRGQKEVGAAGNRHWQLFAAFKKNVRLNFVKRCIAQGHWELSRSQAAEDYVWKEETRVEGTQFELGTKAMKRNSKTDWALQKTLAKEGRLDELDEDIFIRYYSTVKRIASDHAKRPDNLPDVCGIWIWGPPGVGKSTKATTEYGPYYLKGIDKWWDAYEHEETVVIEDVDDTHGFLKRNLKIWADKYAFHAESKGTFVGYIRPKRIIVTSNNSMEQVFGNNVHLEALQRRFTVIHMQNGFQTITQNRNNQ